MSFLELKQLEKTYPDGTRAVRGIDLAVDEGEFVVLLGPSGCGKTTTLRMVAGLEYPTGGHVVLAGREVTGLRPSLRDVGFVFQFYALYPHLSVRENILFPLKSVGMARAEREAALERVVARLGIEHLLARHPRQLSGGDQQRVSLARAMIRKPAIYLMDEPLGTLDADVRQEMREFIRSQQLEMKVTTLYVTHDQEEAMSLGDRVVVMKGGEICQAAPPLDVYEEPASLFVAQFVGSPGMNFMRGEIRMRSGGAVFHPDGVTSVAIPVRRPAGEGAVTLGIRPEYVRLDTGGPIAGTVAMNEYMGSHRFLHVETSFGTVVARAEMGLRMVPGEAVSVALDGDGCRFFDQETGVRRA